MAFQIQGGFDPGAILARQELPPDPQVMQANALKLQAAQQEQSLFPVKQQMAQEQLKDAQYQNRERQLDLQETQTWQQTMQKYGGDFEKARPELAAQLRPKTLAAVDNIYLNHQDKLADIGKKQAEADKANTDLANEEREAFGGIAADVAKAGYSPTAMAASLSMLQKTHPKYQQHIDAIQQQLNQAGQSPDAIKQLVDPMITPKAAAAAQELESKKVTTAEAQQKVITGNIDIAARTVPDNQEDWAKWYAGLDDETKRRVPANYSVAAADKVRRMAVPTKDQPEFDINSYKAKMGLVGNSEYDQFLAQYARSLGKTPAQLSPAEGLASFQKYAEMKQDPVLRENAIAMKQLTEANLRMQQGLMPTPEDIQTYKDALLNHKLSPTQFNELKSRNGNVAGKVFAAAMRDDPNFSPAKAEAEFKAWEKTEADFTSGKEAGLVRSNNNAIEHLALLEQARQALNNNDVPALARIANYFGTATGGTAATTFDHIAARVGDEVQKAFIPGGGSAGERTAAGSGSYSSKMGDAQVANNIKADIALMDSQQRHLVDQYSRGTYNQGSQQLFTPEAQAARDRLLGRQQGSGQPGGQLPKPSGTGQAADAATIKAYLGANGNDKEKTRKALTDAGWVIPKGQ